jgi:hypothetical protein
MADAVLHVVFTDAMYEDEELGPDCDPFHAVMPFSLKIPLPQRAELDAKLAYSEVRVAIRFHDLPVCFLRSGLFVERSLHSYWSSVVPVHPSAI